LRYVLLAFGAIALFVGSFVIFSTLSIMVAQRRWPAVATLSGRKSLGGC